jgi:ring-1,2-phenylacetyl-CoA epoxidase subunit PaaD
MVMGSADAASREAAAWAVLDTVPDPEVPAVSLRELGIVRAVQAAEGGLDVVLTPTYSGCPATEVIASSVCQALEAAGLGPVTVRQQRAPAWTTDWITPEGRRKLHAYGIAPPGAAAAAATVRLRLRQVACPHCGSTCTEQLSAFGSTACKALHRCLDCREPFESFKPI